MNSSYKIVLSISFLLSILVFDLSAQQNNSIFYLHNGSVYIGEVLNDRGESLNVRLIDGNEINFSRYRVKRYLDSKDIVLHRDGKYHVTRGFFFQPGLATNFEGFAPVEEESRISSHTSFLFGYYLNPRFAIGAGIGFEFNQAVVSGFEFDTQVSSQYIYGRYYINNKKRRPFIYSRVGYGTRNDESNFGSNNPNGGINFQAGGGMHFSSRKKSKFVLTLGYHMQKTDGTERFIDDFGSEIIADYDIMIQRLILTFGMEFNKRKKGYVKSF